MNRIKVFTVVFALTLLCLTFQSIAWGSIYKHAVITLDGPVEVPGLHQPVVIGPGTFVFKCMSSALPDRNILMVYNADESRLLATILAVPDYRLEPTDKPIVKFAETAPGSPPAIKEWFFPGQNYGWEFVYRRSRAMEIAKANNQNVLSTREESGDATKLLKANVTAVTPQGGDAEIQTAASPKQ